MSCWRRLAFLALTLAALAVRTPTATANPHGRGVYYRPYYGGYYRPYYGGYYGGYGYYGYPAGVVIVPRPVVVVPTPVYAPPAYTPGPPPPPPPLNLTPVPQNVPGQLRYPPIQDPNIPPVP